MRTPLRAAIAIALVVIVFLVKTHLDSILQWQNDEFDLENARKDHYVLDGGAYIELVSAPPIMPTPQNPTRRKWTPMARPTRSLMPKSEPMRIPVDVPGAEWAGQDPFSEDPGAYRGLYESFEMQNVHADLLSPVVHGDVVEVVSSTTAPPRPRITPKSDRIIVLGKMSYENTDWLEEQLPE